LGRILNEKDQKTLISANGFCSSLPSDQLRSPQLMIICRARGCLDNCKNITS